MRKLAIALGVVVALIIGAAIALPKLVTPEAIKAKLTQLVQEKTGRELAINGELSFTYWPQIGVKMEAVQFSNARWSNTPNMLDAEALTVALEVLPLLRKEVVVREVSLIRPTITLEVTKDGSANWQFATIGEPVQLASNEPAAAAPKKAPLEKLAIDQLHIEDGTVHYIAPDRKETISKLMLDAAIPAFDKAATLSLDGHWHDGAVSADITLTSLETVMQQRPAQLKAAINGPAFTVRYNGTLQHSDSIRYQGNLDLQSSKLADTIEWATGKAPEGTLPGKVMLKSPVEGTEKTLTLSQMTLDVDALKLAGKSTIDWSGTKPKLTLDWTSEHLDLTPFMPKEQASLPWLPALIASAHAAPTEGWSTDPIDLSALNAVNATIALKTPRLTAKQFDLTNLALTGQLNGGTFTGKTEPFGLYDGNLAAQWTVKQSKGAPAFTVTLDGSGIQVEPLLKATAQFEKLTGTATTKASITGAGPHLKAIMSSLNGAGNIMLANGKIKGMDLAGMVRNVKAALNPDRSTEERSTDFAELGGSFNITDGIVKNDDLKLQNPFLRLSGQGTVNLPEQSLNYRIQPRVIGSAKGQGGEFDKSGVTVPVIVSGPWSKPSFRPDLESTIRKATENPEAIKNTVDQLKKDPKKALENFLGGF